jgi:hypothetical protein
MNAIFGGHTGKSVGSCPVCKHTVHKEQSRTKIGGMMLRNKVRQFSFVTFVTFPFATFVTIAGGSHCIAAAKDAGGVERPAR